MKYLYLVLLLTSYSTGVFAENITALGDVYVRESPPNGLFCSKGAAFGIINNK